MKRSRLLVWGIIPLFFGTFLGHSQAAEASFVRQLCPTTGLEMRGSSYPPGGIIITAFDYSSMWVYNVEKNSRYPLPDTNPCGTNCRLSPDASWITFVDTQTAGYGRMRLNGTDRRPLVNYASDLEWWSADTLLVWTPGHRAYLLPLATNTPQAIGESVTALLTVQPQGYAAIRSVQTEQGFNRQMTNLTAVAEMAFQPTDPTALQSATQPNLPLIELGSSTPYYNAAGWSPNGNWFVYAASVPVQGYNGSELLGFQPATSPAPYFLTSLSAAYGAVRVNGRAEASLSWSPNSRLIAFWVLPLLGADPATQTGTAMLHTLDVQTGELTAYCGLVTNDHTPNPPRLVWSPDSQHLAFGVDLPDDNRSTLLMALDTLSGQFTILSEGLVPTLGNGGVVAWGWPPA